jgi:signal peptidase I
VHVDPATQETIQPLRILIEPPRPKQLGTKRAWAVSTIVLGCVALLVLLATLALALGLGRLVVIDSGSMRPSLNPGDVAVLTPEPAAAVVSGQIVAFHPPGEPRVTVIHRVHRLRRTREGIVIRTKGDANDAADPWRAKIVGGTVWRETARLPWVGFPVVWSQQPYIRMAVLTLMLILMVSIVFAWIWKPASRRASRRFTPGHIG